MKVSYPVFGTADTTIFLFFRALGIDVVKNSGDMCSALQKGALYAPDDICLPFKLMLGNLIDSYEEGGRVAVMPSSKGPCRLGEYSDLLASVLKKEGYDFEWIVLDTISDIGIKNLIERVKKLLKYSDSRVRRKAFIVNLIKALGLQREIDNLDHRMRILSGNVEIVLTEIYRDFHREINNVYDFSKAYSVCKKFKKKVKDIEREWDYGLNPVRIVLTGEIYSLVEPFASHYIDEALMDLRVSFRKKVNVSWWVFRTLRIGSTGKASDYIPCSIGGYGKETIEEASRAKCEGFDGIIQIFPSGCMPEIVSKSVMEKIKREKDIPVTTLIFDEIDGTAGYITRLEAFVDMLKTKKEKNL